MPLPQNSVLSDALAKLRNPALADAAALATQFPLPLRAKTQRVKDIQKDRDKKRARRLMRAENAEPLVAQFPIENGDSLHAWIPGDFIFGEILPVICRSIAIPARIDLATLSLSENNIKTLEKLLNDNTSLRITLALSHYFRSTSPDIFRALTMRLSPNPRFSVAVGRIHAKIVLLHIPERPLVIETSANLRSSNCIETVAVHQCPELFAFHLSFLEDFHALCAAGTHEGFSGVNPEEHLTAGIE